MAKWLPLYLLCLATTSAFAQATTPALTQLNAAINAVTSCLSSSSGSSSAAGSKTSCVQNAINAEATNQINSLFQTYANAVNFGISYYGSQAGTNTPNSSTGGGSGSNTSGGSTSGTGGGTTSTFVYPRSKSPPPAPGQSPGASALPPQPSKSPGGIQYY